MARPKVLTTIVVNNKTKEVLIDKKEVENDKKEQILKALGLYENKDMSELQQ